MVISATSACSPVSRHSDPTIVKSPTNAGASLYSSSGVR
jgi:hypothetical protein